MSYPGLPLDVARLIDETRRTEATSSLEVKDATIWKSGADFDESTAADCLQCCTDLTETESSHAEFDSKCAPIVHGMNLSVRIAGDPDFWRWLTFTQGNWGAEIVDWRYGSGRGQSATSAATNRKARPVYYGLGLMKKGMFAKLWLCADRMHVEGMSGKYDGIDYADVDLWDSHIIDVDYGSVPVMARAFVKVVRDLSLPRGGPKPPDAPPGYRDLAKEIRRRHATVAFELFDEIEAREYVTDVWNERESWCKR